MEIWGGRVKVIHIFTRLLGNIFGWFVGFRIRNLLLRGWGSFLEWWGLKWWWFLVVAFWGIIGHFFLTSKLRSAPLLKLLGRSLLVSRFASAFVIPALLDIMMWVSVLAVLPVELVIVLHEWWILSARLDKHILDFKLNFLQVLLLSTLAHLYNWSYRQTTKLRSIESAIFKHYCCLDSTVLNITDVAHHRGTTPETFGA